MWWGYRDKGTLLPCWWKCNLVCSPCGNCKEIPKKLEISSNSTSGNFSKENENTDLKKIGATCMFIAASFAVAGEAAGRVLWAGSQVGVGYIEFCWHRVSYRCGPQDLRIALRSRLGNRGPWKPSKYFCVTLQERDLIIFFKWNSFWSIMCVHI